MRDLTPREIEKKRERGDRFIVLCWARWEGNGLRLRRLFEERGGYRVFGLDLDGDEDHFGYINSVLGVRSVPEVHLFDGGQRRGRRVGYFEDFQWLDYFRE